MGRKGSEKVIGGHGGEKRIKNRSTSMKKEFVKESSNGKRD